MMTQPAHIVERIRAEVPPGTAIPKPYTGDYLTKGWGRRRGRPALVYRIPNLRDPKHPHEKGTTDSEFTLAYDQLNDTGTLTREWFNRNLWGCAQEGSCNFTTIGGVFELLGEASWAERGVYRRTTNEEHFT